MNNTDLLTKSASYNLVDIINMGVALGILVAGLLSVFYIFYGGLSFILAAGDESKIKQAVHTIRYAIIGLVVTIFAVTFIAIVGNIFGFNLVSYITWEKIGEMIQAIIETITGQTGRSLPGRGTLQ